MFKGLLSRVATLRPAADSITRGQTAFLFAIVALNQVFNVGATAGFALSGRSIDGRSFLLWQIIGSLFGLGAQLTFAGMVRYSSVSVANAIGIGLAFVSAQVFVAFYFFKESFTPVQSLGTLFVFLGILFVALGR
jgi:drug/metabolite transporter (DMT)-like permease